jgi:hypothetical protein
LLQQVVAALNHANSASYWSPVTFAVTVVIGVIALWFALLPVLQGIVYPPDRVKYSRTAIGRWHELVELTWNWADMSYAATTWTPILDLDIIAAYLATQDRGLSDVGSDVSEARRAKKCDPTSSLGASQGSKIPLKQTSDPNPPDVEAAIGMFSHTEDSTTRQMHGS